MSKLAFLSSGTGVTVGAGTLVVGVALTAAYVSGAFNVDAPDTPVSEQAASAAPVTTVPKTSEAELETTHLPAEAPVVAPTFDVVRVEKDGSAMIAGQAKAGARVEIRIDDLSRAEVTAGSDGSFASFLKIDPNTEPQVISLKVDEMRSEEQVIIAPISAPNPDVPETGQNKVAQGEAPQPIPTPAPQTTALSSDTPVSKPDDQSIAPSSPLAVPDVPKAPAVLIANDDGVRVLQPADTQAMTELLSTISYDASGDVSLTGRGEAAYVRVYLDNAPITTSRIGEAGNWRADLPVVDTGIYTLRVDELDTAGDVVSRVETPFKREDAVTLAAATQDNKTIQSITVQPGATLWALARDRYGDGTLYTRLFDANRDSIRNPDLIYPGQVFAIPEG